MPQLPVKPAVAAQRLPLYKDPAANAGTQGEQDGGFAALEGTILLSASRLYFS